MGYTEKSLLGLLTDLSSIKRFSITNPSNTNDVIATLLSKVWSDRPSYRLNLFLKITTIRIFPFGVGLGYSLIE